MKKIQFIFCFLLAMFLCGFGCSASKPTPDPLAGFHPFFKILDQSIVNDYQDYIQKLSPEEKKYMGPTESFEDSTGQHAIRIETDINGKEAWYHVLIYDKDNKRIKVITYYKGRYQSKNLWHEILEFNFV